ncbi:CDP-diacylglycerol--glycerol-3-phosphate 3-phosphatidyltransferase [Candidatus Bealeia paramacronuclearis]|uniref:CDP-diacylglycerol--glycerol-3-phosphate 3-phosphatidyltransferase n=1 Tax=Candidatus Bealeia paramacronuclearis TaxID=1921001 RepID=A0ABZ2C4R3_9PROT|nr:CDP-diacylglycerol--glycerol-3-phosphate 3-phosphatidyltransferase [Candidatus Bealeia paramacronuclearis]
MNLPNFITLARLLSVPVIVWLILLHEQSLAFIIFLIASISDALDGFLARILKERTTLGAYLDPIADKALLVGVYAALGNEHLIPLWVVILVIFRDTIIIGGIILLGLLSKTFKMEPFLISKINTTIQLLYIVYVLSPLPAIIGIPILGEMIAWTVGITTLISGASYVKVGLEILTREDV